MSAGSTSEGRARVLGNIRRALHRGPLAQDQQDVVERRLRERPRGPVPARGQLDAEGRLDLFQRMAEEVSATVERLDAWADIPGAMAGYLRKQNLPSEFTMAPHPELTGLQWAWKMPTVVVTEGPAHGHTAIGLSRAFAGVAETGTLMLRSGADSPTTLNFLPDTHVVAVKADEIVGGFEEAWERLRASLNGRSVPRTVNLITGPSRTADIEQTLQLGAHGPRRLHIFVVTNDAGG